MPVHSNVVYNIKRNVNNKSKREVFFKEYTHSTCKYAGGGGIIEIRINKTVIKMRRKGKLYVILSLILVVGLMIVGYAAYNQHLSISETSKIDSNFNILITNIETKEVGGEAINESDPTYNGLEANFNITFNKKNDYIEYNVEVSNKGSIEAYLNQIKIENENSKVVNMSYRDINIGEELLVGESKTFVVRIEYKGGSGSGEITLNLDYSADNNPGEIIVPEENYKVIYNTEENGGEKGEIEEKYYKKGEEIDLKNVGKKEGYTFVGWNINKESKEAIKTLQMGEEEITLYAIYKKEIEARYKIGDGIKEIPKEKETCEIYNKEDTCKIELPDIEEIKPKEGRVIEGWYKDNAKVENNTQTLKENSIYEIKAYPDIPANIEINTSSLSNGIRVVTNVLNIEEVKGIEKYEYSIDNAEYIESNNTYTFDNLEHNTEHTIKVRVTTIGNAVTEKEITVRTQEIATPTFEEEIDGVVTITYPSECESRYTCTYIKDNGEETQITKNPEEVIFGANGTLIAKVTDGTNYITSSTYIVERTNLYVSNNGNDTNGYGTKEAPYKTLNKAYDSASLTNESTIYVMDDIAPTEPTHLDEDKDIILTSYSENNTINSIMKTDSFIDTKYEMAHDNYMIVLDKGNLTTRNINLNGNDLVFIGGAITNKSGTTLNLLTETTISHFKASGSNGAAVRVNTSQSAEDIAKLNIDGATISYNENTQYDGGGIFVSNYNSFTMKSGNITNNKAKYRGGAILNVSHSSVVILNGSIQNNSANQGGAIYTEQASLTIENGNINGNTVTGSGGALFVSNNSIFNMSGGIISNNAITEDGAGHDGGGMLLNGVTSKITGGTIKSNTAIHSGSGIQIYGGTLTIDGGEIINNSGTSGLGLYNNAKVIVTGGTINSNTNSSAPSRNNFNFSDETSIFTEQKTNTTIKAKSHFIVTALNNNFGLNVASTTIANGTNIQLYTKANTNSQKWRIMPYRVVNGVTDYIIQSQMNGTQYVWISGNSSTTGANVQTWEFHSSIGGYWRLTNQGSGYYQIKNIGGLCLGTASTTAANGTDVRSYTCNNATAQKWKFVETT